MIDLILGMPWGLSLLLSFTVTLLPCLIALKLLHRAIDPAILRTHHDLAGISLQIVGMIYAILLGFIVSYVQGINTRASNAVELESEALILLNRNAGLLDPALRSKVRDLTSVYVTSVIEHDWPQLNKRYMPTNSRGHLNNLYRAVYIHQPKSDHELVWYEECVSTLGTIANARTERIGTAMNGLGPMLWTLLLVGAGVIVAGLMFFGSTHRILHRVMIGMLSGLVTFLLIVILDLEHPFAGGITVGVEPFQRVQEIMSNLPD